MENTKTIMFNGIKFKRCINDRYYGPGRDLSKAGIERLHREVWKKYNGDILPGYSIHHIDFNTENNDISNLQMVSKGEHAKIHEARNKTNPEFIRKRTELLNRIRPLTKKWHGGEEGLK